MRIKPLIVLMAALFIAAGTENAVLAEMSAEQKKDMEAVKNNFKYTSVTTKEGLVFRVPEDMPIETRAGIQAPVPFDEYMYGKFKQIDEKLARIEKKLDTIETTLKGQAPKAPEEPANKSVMKVL